MFIIIRDVFFNSWPISSILLFFLNQSHPHFDLMQKKMSPMPKHPESCLVFVLYLVYFSAGPWYIVVTIVAWGRVSNAALKKPGCTQLT